MQIRLLIAFWTICILTACNDSSDDDGDGLTCNVNKKYIKPIDEKRFLDSVKVYRKREALARLKNMK